MGRLNEALVNAGILLAADGLTSDGGFGLIPYLSTNELSECGPMLSR